MLQGPGRVTREIHEVLDAAAERHKAKAESSSSSLPVSTRIPALPTVEAPRAEHVSVSSPHSHVPNLLWASRPVIAIRGPR
jgi:hypothetical protein